MWLKGPQNWKQATETHLNELTKHEFTKHEIIELTSFHILPIWVLLSVFLSVDSYLSKFLMVWGRSGSGSGSGLSCLLGVRWNAPSIVFPCGWLQALKISWEGSPLKVLSMASSSFFCNWVEFWMTLDSFLCDLDKFLSLLENCFCKWVSGFISICSRLSIFSGLGLRLVEILFYSIAHWSHWISWLIVCWFSNGQEEGLVLFGQEAICSRDRAKAWEGKDR